MDSNEIDGRVVEIDNLAKKAEERSIPSNLAIIVGVRAEALTEHR